MTSHRQHSEVIPQDSDPRLSLDGRAGPYEVLEFDLFTFKMGRPPQPLLENKEARGSWLLIRFDGEPIGRMIFDQANISTDRIQSLAERQFAERIELLRAETESLGISRAEKRRSAARASRNRITAVVCTTAARPDGLRRCLESLKTQTYTSSSFLIVDNSRTGKAQELCADLLSDSRFSYVREPSPGLARARNTAIAHTTTPLIAWLDDDEIADPRWLEEYVAIFTENPEVSVACGMMAPAELATPPQIWFEQWGGHSKGRGFSVEVFKSGVSSQSPLYPLPAFGSGGNMAYRLDEIKAIGGFDIALGAGSLAKGAEDTRAFTETLLRGGTMVFSPAPLTFHYHRADDAGLYAQLEGYGIGITAFYSSLLWAHPTKILQLFRQLPGALADLGQPNSVRNQTILSDFPAAVMKANRRGMLVGPFAYARGRRNK